MRATSTTNMVAPAHMTAPLTRFTRAKLILIILAARLRVPKFMRHRLVGARLCLQGRDAGVRGRGAGDGHGDGTLGGLVVGVFVVRVVGVVVGRGRGGGGFVLLFGGRADPAACGGGGDAAVEEDVAGDVWAARHAVGSVDAVGVSGFRCTGYEAIVIVLYKGCVLGKT